MGVKCPKCHFDNPDDTFYCGKCATPLYPYDQFSVTKTLITTARGLPKGTIIADKYRIIEKLGEGGMGVVYKAEDRRLKRTVALKFLPSELTRYKEAKERFVREAQAAAALSHPNICTIHEIDEDESKSFIAMEYIEGQSVREKTKKGPLDLTDALNIAIQAAQGLEEAHNKGIIHRDIKSANIMITPSGQAKIMDFGLAKMTGASLITKEATTMGTVAYMSPEQSQGEATDQRTDIWSMGVVLYELLTGHLPFSGEHEQSVIYCILNRDPKPVVAIRNEVPKELDLVVGKALQKDPDERYQSVGDLLDDLRTIAKGMEPFKLKEVTRKILKVKKSYLYPGIAALFILLIVAGVVLITGRSPAIDSIAVLPLENLSGDADQEYFAEGMHEALITELSKIKALKVISRPSVMRYKNSDKSLREIANELNVEGIIAGSALQEGERVRITVQLIEAKTEQNLWAERYDKDYRDILMLHGEVAQDMAQEIKIAVTSQEQERLSIAQRVNPEAYEAFLKGNYYMNQFSPEDLNRSIEYFQKAIEINPDYAPAYSGLADAYINSAMGHGTQLPEEAFPKAKSAALKALEIDNSLSIAHTALAQVEIFYYWDWSIAERECLRAIELNPNDPKAYNIYSNYLSVIKGRHEEALTAIRQAQKLDPLSLIINADMGLVLVQLGQYGQAIEQLLEVLKMDTNFVPAIWALGEAYRRQGVPKEAITWFKKAFTASGEHSVWLAPLGLAYAEAGWRDEAQEVLERLTEQYHDNYKVSPTGIAAIHEALGEKEYALEWFEKAIEKRDSQAPGYKFYNIFNSMRSEPRFRALLKKMNLE